MWKIIKDYLQLLIAYLRINLNAQLEYRGAFVSESTAPLSFGDGVNAGERSCGIDACASTTITICRRRCSCSAAPVT